MPGRGSSTRLHRQMMFYRSKNLFRSNLVCRMIAHKGRAREAVAGLEDVIHRTESTELLEEMCHLAFANDLLDVAERGLSTLTNRCPANASAFHNLGLVYLKRHNY